MASQFHKPYHVLFILTDKSGVMSFLHNNESDARLVTNFQLDASLTDGL